MTTDRREFMKVAGSAAAVVGAMKPLPTVSVRIVSVLADCHQHAGEASYIRGLLKAKGKRR